ncbi:MAG TPA: hypothetical protein VKA21_00475 [Candidatus Binatia bacterium]|nr:hypothetical protein [Candidatus Binatia bacterium]
MKRRRRVPRPFDVALAATLHDPSGALADALARALPRLATLYRGVAVASSPPTAARIRRLLAAAGMDAGTVRSNRRGALYRLAVRAALASGTARIHYVDFDRALHWLLRDARELRSALRLARRHRVLLLGRTPKAHRSHHVPLWATETLANRLIAERLGLPRPLDLLVPSFVLDREGVAALLARSRARDASVYGEWAALVLGLAPEVAYLECRGLEWETPDRHRRAVRRAGLAAWRRRQETRAEWELRVAMAVEFLRGFGRVVTRGSVPRPSLKRLPPRA